MRDFQPAAIDAAQAGARLTIGLDAVCANWRLLAGMTRGRCAAVLKADAYGLGMARVAPALARAGCDTFFTAHLHEGVRLRQLLGPSCTIFVLHGPPPGTADECVRHDLTPVLNDPGQVREWQALAHRLDRQLAAALQVDTGMSRMGLAPEDLAALRADPAALRGIRPVLLMSHLACADLPQDPWNAEQRRRFDIVRAAFPGVPASLANSSGVFLGADFHYDLLRPGAALYGINPQPGAPNPLRQAVSLSARIIQTRTIQAGTIVGYGGRYMAADTRRIATIAIGYADGWLRSHTGNGAAWIDGVAAPFVGTVSMDSITLDVTGVDPARVMPGEFVDLICAEQPLDTVAFQAGTIGYEVLTRLGSRFHREYQGG